jgi:hypothetical protein
MMKRTPFAAALMGVLLIIADSTQGCTARFVWVEPSTAVFHFANHVAAAYPVMALGVAVWALAQTGPLDEIFIPPSGEGAPYWNGKKPKDLPNLLSSHQVAGDQPGAGSFYWQFQHGEGDLNNCTEAAIFATLGLVAASKANPALNPDSAISTARDALLGGVKFLRQSLGAPLSGGHILRRV